MPVFLLCSCGTAEEHHREGSEIDLANVNVIAAVDRFAAFTGSGASDWAEFVDGGSSDFELLEGARDLQRALGAEAGGGKRLWGYATHLENVNTVWVAMSAMFLLASCGDLEAKVWALFCQDVLETGNLQEARIVLAGLSEARRMSPAGTWAGLVGRMDLEEEWLTDLFDRELSAAILQPEWYGYQGVIEAPQRDHLILEWTVIVERARAKRLSALPFLDSIRSESLFGVAWGLRIATDITLLSQIRTEIGAALQLSLPNSPSGR